LAERGLVERVRRDRDRRKVELKLTTTGRLAINHLIPMIAHRHNLMLAEFSGSEVLELHRLLELEDSLSDSSSLDCQRHEARAPIAICNVFVNAFE
jgi:hypothetical protein